MVEAPDGTLLASYDLAYDMRYIALRYFNAAGATERLGEHHGPETHLFPNVPAGGARPASGRFGFWR